MKMNIQLKNTKSIIEIFSSAYNITETEKQLLDIIKNASYKTIEIVKKNGNTIAVKATKSQYSANLKELLKTIEQRGYNRINVFQKDGKTFFITPEDHYKL
jgi:DNA polymerase III sliding clamp (beta) subunit (PCNA family)